MLHVRSCFRRGNPAVGPFGLSIWGDLWSCPRFAWGAIWATLKPMWGRTRGHALAHEAGMLAAKERNPDSLGNPLKPRATTAIQSLEPVATTAVGCVATHYRCSCSKGIMVQTSLRVVRANQVNNMAPETHESCKSGRRKHGLRQRIKPDQIKPIWARPMVFRTPVPSVHYINQTRTATEIFTPTGTIEYNAQSQGNSGPGVITQSSINAVDNARGLAWGGAWRRGGT